MGHGVENVSIHAARKGGRNQAVFGERRLVGGEERDGGGKLLRLADPAERRRLPLQLATGRPGRDCALRQPIIIRWALPPAAVVLVLVERSCSSHSAG